MFDRRLLQCFDWGLLLLTLALGGAGLVALYSAVSAGMVEPDILLFKKQLIWYGVGFVAMVFCFLFDYKQIERFATFIYLMSVGSLVVVLFFGKIVGGSKRWLPMGPFSLQPSEMAKIAVIIILARYFAKIINTEGLNLRDLAVPVLLTVLPFGLIVRQPDLGTAMVIALIAGAMTLFVKIERRTLTWLIATFTLMVPLVWFFLRGYQKQRILTFLNPDRDPLGAGYHIIQSKIAIGSGMLTGKGFLKGTQNALSFLPEQHTDFIFSVLAEEWGLMGSLTVIVLFLIIITWGLNIAGRCRDPFGTILSVGVTSMIAWQVLINIGMVMGLMPVVGVTLPFISYGGSSIITMMMGVGLLMNVSMRRFKFE
ncbi:rod shape-determining protein RodA [uncultured Desulfosarcina sp.]|uniref:rod shape-determining protein RodA n=1 Tax=uncultured Desulfosarcina sp. TaxID=218289 RepID=UPI0029C7B94E|nr:rod shape-determining protein RodA [uncultured Desulfosarcina sp.]